MDVVSTVKGNISSKLYEFALLVDGPDSHEIEWVLNCCACFAFNDVTTISDLIGLKFDDLGGTEKQTGLALTGGQRAWIRRCVDKANKEFVEAIAMKGENPLPQRSGASAVKALADIIKSQEARTSIQFM